MKVNFKREAIELRRLGLSYSEVLKQVPVSKSTLSLWLRSVGLSRSQRQRLTEKKLEAMKKGWEKMRQKRIERSRIIRERAEKEAHILLKNPLWLSGVLLYWAEGSKEKDWRPSEKVSLSNMDVNVHRLFLKWLRLVGIRREDIYCELYIHKTGDIKSAQSFWARELGFSPGGIRVYLKRHSIGPSRKNIGREYHGTLRILVRRSTDFNRKIAGWIKGVVAYFCNK